MVSWDHQVPILSSSGGTASWQATVPSWTTLIGLDFFNQCWVLDSNANAAGIATSNGGRGTIGY